MSDASPRENGPPHDFPGSEDLPRHLDLIERYFAGLLTAEESAELERLLVLDPGAAAAFAFASREEGQFVAHYRRLRDQAVVQDLLQTLTSPADGTAPTQGEAATRGSAPAAPSGKTSPLWSIAALLLLSIGAATIYWLAPWRTSTVPTAESAVELVAGTISIDGRTAAVGGAGLPRGAVPDGVPFEVTGAAPAVLRLADGSEAELAPVTRAVLRGDADSARRAVVLERGSGRFQVAGLSDQAADRPFRVETPVGNVFARGTEFTVEVRSPEPDPRALLAAAPQLLVAVLAGEVAVDYDHQTYALGLGDDRIYAAALSLPETQADLVGKVISVVRNDDAQTTVINLETGKGPSTKSGVHKIRLTPATQLAWVNVPVDRQRPSIGYTAAIWRDSAQPGTATAVRFEAAQVEGPPPQLSGLVTEVSPDGGRITLELPRHLKNEPSRTRQIVIDEATRVSYFFLPPAAERPTVGYRTTVWLAAAPAGKHAAAPGQQFAGASTDRAGVVHFSGDKRGGYRPDLSGQVESVSNDGREWKLIVKEKVPGKGVVVTSRSVNVAPDTKIVFDGDPVPSPVGREASVWLREGSTDTAAGIRLLPR